jgi:hypothetical protein
VNRRSGDQEGQEEDPFVGRRDRESRERGERSEEIRGVERQEARSEGERRSGEIQ